MSDQPPESTKSRFAFVPILTTVLAVVGVVTVFAAQFLYAEKYPVLDVLYENVGDAGALESSGESSIGPPTVTVTSDTAIVGLFGLGAVMCAAAMFVGFRRYKSGDHSHATAAGFTVGALGLVWIAKIIVGGIN